MMGRRFTRGGMMSMMDTPELRGLAAFMRRGHWFRDDEGHPGGGDTGEDHPDDPDMDDSDDDGSEDGADDSGDGDDDKDDDTDPDDKPKYSQREYDKMKRRLAASDKKQGDLQKQINELKASGADKLDKAVKAEIDELRPKAAKLESDNARLRLELAFVNTPVKGVTWVDPEAALRLIDLSDVDVDPETGAIDKRDLAAAARKLAKDKPYLVKKADTASGDTSDDNTDSTDTRSSGAPMNGRRKGRVKPTSRSELVTRFPVLNQLGGR
jgi:hypothetical protein